MSGSSRQTLQRWVLGLLWSLKPPRLYGVPATLLMLARHYTGLGPAPGTLPDPAQALRFPDGLAGICTDMSVPTLTAAYAKGLFPLAHIGPQKWWAPAERIISFPDSGHISKNVRRLLRVEQFEVTFEYRFRRGHRGLCRASSRTAALTWIRPDIIAAYRALHEAGYAHSVEVWGPLGQSCRRTLRRRDRQGVLHRVDFRAAAGRVEGGFHRAELSPPAAQ